jgi:hypothetical protein
MRRSGVPDKALRARTSPWVAQNRCFKSGRPSKTVGNTNHLTKNASGRIVPVARPTALQSAGKGHIVLGNRHPADIRACWQIAALLCAMRRLAVEVKEQS